MYIDTAAALGLSKSLETEVRVVDKTGARASRFFTEALTSRERER